MLLRQTLSKISEVRAVMTPHLNSESPSNVQRYLTTCKREQETSELKLQDIEANATSMELASRQCTGCIPLKQYSRKITTSPYCIRVDIGNDVDTTLTTEADNKTPESSVTIMTESNETPGQAAMVNAPEREDITPGVVGVLTEAEECVKGFEKTRAHNSSPVVMYKQDFSYEPSDNDIIQQVVTHIMPEIDQNFYEGVYGHLVVDLVERNIEEAARSHIFKHHDTEQCSFNDTDMFEMKDEHSNADAILQKRPENLKETDVTLRKSYDIPSASKQIQQNSMEWNKVISPELRKYSIPVYDVINDFNKKEDIKEQKKKKDTNVEITKMQKIQMLIETDQRCDSKPVISEEDKAVKSTIDSLLHRISSMLLTQDIREKVDDQTSLSSVLPQLSSANTPSGFFRKKDPPKTPVAPPAKCLPIRRVNPPLPKYPLNNPGTTLPSLPPHPLPARPNPIPYPSKNPYISPATDPVYTSPLKTPSPPPTASPLAQPKMPSQPGAYPGQPTEYAYEVPCRPEFTVPAPPNIYPNAPECPQTFPLPNPLPESPQFIPYPAPENPPCPCPLPTSPGPSISPAKSPSPGEPFSTPAKTAPCPPTKGSCRDSRCPTRGQCPPKICRKSTNPCPKSSKSSCKKNPGPCRIQPIKPYVSTPVPCTEVPSPLCPQTRIPKTDYVPFKGVEKKRLAETSKFEFSSPIAKSPCILQSPIERIDPHNSVPRYPGFVPPRPKKPKHADQVCWPSQQSSPHETPDPMPKLKPNLNPTSPVFASPTFPKSEPAAPKYVPDSPQAIPAAPAYPNPYYTHYSIPYYPQYNVPYDQQYHAPLSPQIHVPYNTPFSSPADNKYQPYPMPQVPLPTPTWGPEPGKNP